MRFNSTVSPLRSFAAKLAALFASASLLSIPSSHVVAQADEIPETVLITGSLIRGVLTPQPDIMEHPYPVDPLPGDTRACAMPEASDSSTVVLLGPYEADALSTTTIGSQETVVQTGSIVIERGREPIYLVVTSQAPIIWRVSGAVERLERLVLTSGSNGPESVTLNEPPLVGATGVPAGKITFLQRVDCLLHFSEASSNASIGAADTVAHETGKAPAIIAADYQVAGFSVPSGQVRKNRPRSGPFVILRRFVSDLHDYHPGGIIAINPRRVIATQPAARYEVWPERAGLLQLVRSGALRPVRASGEFLITRKIRFPAGLAGYKFVLLRGVPEPDGDIRFLGTTTVISEETGRPIAFDEAQRRSEEERLAPEARGRAACAMPRASEAANVMFLNTYEAEALSTTTIASQDVAVGTASLTIERGHGPIYLVINSYQPIIWRVSGALERLERLVLISGKSLVQGTALDYRPLVGATGVAPDKVTFLGRTDCIRYFNDVRSISSVEAAALIARETGKAPTAIANRYTFAGFSVPSGQFQTERKPNGPIYVMRRSVGPRPILPQGDGKRYILETPGIDSLERELLTLIPGGVVEIDPASVVASQPVEPYVVLPKHAGLLQLVRSGALTLNSSGEFLITRKFRKPAELWPPAAFLLLRGVPEPDGDFEHSRVISEETGMPITLKGVR